ncbi:HSP20 family protein [Dyella sp. OK004]|uniref:Hsp20/alpha crystallin family protein n=1 Tax=Dyella sp. OK004 TaxID=1855292 RepID=UPI0008E490D3|nr:Hsp20/alpha crystallin family protein [Dyella sp. OK004]SFS12856.1 HSP20 family protein [Dyella sp. OK004]
MNLSRNFSWSSNHLGDIREAFDRLLNPDEIGPASAASHWAPRVDIKEDDKRFVILADIPGVDPADIEVSMDKGVLIIKGERKQESEEQGPRLTRQERNYGAFFRRFALPDSADAEGITANGKHGVLEVVIPKRAETAPRRITINTTH